MNFQTGLWLVKPSSSLAKKTKNHSLECLWEKLVWSLTESP